MSNISLIKDAANSVFARTTQPSLTYGMTHSEGLFILNEYVKRSDVTNDVELENQRYDSMITQVKRPRAHLHQPQHLL